MRIDRLISQGRQSTERIQSKIIRDTIEHIYQTPFKLLGKSEEKKYEKSKETS